MAAMTKPEWLAQCAARFTERANVPKQTALDFAETCWDVCADDVGEVRVLTDCPPADLADRAWAFFWRYSGQGSPRKPRPSEHSTDLDCSGSGGFRILRDI